MLLAKRETPRSAAARWLARGGCGALLAAVERWRAGWLARWLARCGAF
jgi:hypothetical protein